MFRCNDLIKSMFFTSCFGLVAVAANTDPSNVGLKLNEVKTSSIEADGVGLFYGSSYYINSGKRYFDESGASNFISTLGLKADLESKNQTDSSWKVDGEIFYSVDEESPYWYIPDTYYNWSWRSSGTSLTAGRKLISWSKGEEVWGEGLWQPRYSWNPMVEKSEGLTGFFLSKSGTNFSLMAFASPIYIPELAPMFKEEDGKLVSKNPWFPALPETLPIFEVDNEVIYKVRTPEVSDVVLQSSAALKAEYRLHGFFAQASFADKPMNTFMIRMPYTQNINQTIDVEVIPVTLRHQVLSLGIGRTIDRWSAWVDMTTETPQMDDPDKSWISQNAVQSRQMTSYVGYEFADFTQAYWSHHQLIQGAHAKDLGENASAEGSMFGSRFRFFNASKIGLKNFRPFSNKRFSLSGEMLFDFAQNAGILKAGSRIRISSNTSIEVQASMLGLIDESEVDQDDGFIRSFRANDNVTARVTYVY